VEGLDADPLVGRLARGLGSGVGVLVELSEFTLRFAVLIPVSVVRLLRVRHQETIVIRDWQRSQLADLPQTAPDLSDAPAPLAHRS
jgi:hypothetical protein